MLGFTVKLAVYFFCAMWLSAVGSSATPVITAFTVAPHFNIGPTKYCIGTVIPKYVGANATVPLVNDTLLFLALHGVSNSLHMLKLGKSDISRPLLRESASHIFQSFKPRLSGRTSLFFVSKIL